MAEFNLIAFEKIATRRNVIEQIFNLKRSAVVTDGWVFTFNLIALNFNFDACFLIGLFGFEGDVCNGRNRCQCFSSETFGLQLEKIFGATEFTCGVSEKALFSVCGIHAFAVVYYLNKGFTGVFDN